MAQLWAAFLRPDVQGDGAGRTPPGSGAQPGGAEVVAAYDARYVQCEPRSLAQPAVHAVLALGPH